MAVLPDFRLEAYLAQWEFAARYHMTASDAESISLAELLKLAEPSDREAFEQLWLGYLPPAGSEALRDAIASTYTAVSSDNVLAFAGGGEAIYTALHALLQPDDHAIVITPTYQSLETIALSLSKTTGIALDADSGWRLDLNEVRDAVRSNTKLIAINFPNNPTGKVLSLAEFDQLVEICREHGLWLLSDEVYRLSERPPSLTRRLRSIGMSVGFPLVSYPRSTDCQGYVSAGSQAGTAIYCNGWSGLNIISPSVTRHPVKPWPSSRSRQAHAFLIGTGL